MGDAGAVHLVIVGSGGGGLRPREEQLKPHSRFTAGRLPQLLAPGTLCPWLRKGREAVPLGDVGAVWGQPSLFTPMVTPGACEGGEWRESQCKRIPVF